MAAYSLSTKTAVDLDGLYEYTIVTFGLDQARTYPSGLHKQFQTLAEHRIQGRSATELAPGLRRADYRSHVVFYMPNDDSVLIVRVLHQSMDMRRHL